MPVRIEDRGPVLLAEVRDSLQLEDADLIEAAAQEVPAGGTVLVDLRATRDKHLLALWRLAQVARRQPGRFRLTGLTLADSRFLTMLDLPGGATDVH